MRTYLRRVLPATLVAGGFALAVTGAVLDTEHRMLPGSLLLVICGAATHLYLHLNPARHPSAPRILSPVPRVAQVVPTQRGPAGARGPGVPSPHGPVDPPRSAPVLPVAAEDVLGAPAEWPDLVRHSGPQRAGVQHRVLPHGGLPHQRQASNGS